MQSYFRDSALEQLRLARSAWRVFCASNHPLTRHKGTIPITELDHYSWVRNAAAPSIAPFVPQFEGFNKSPLGSVSVIMAGSQQMAKQLVIHSNALGYGPRLTWDVDLAHGTVVELDLPISELYVVMTEIRRRDAHSAVLEAASAISEKYFANRSD